MSTTDTKIAADLANQKKQIGQSEGKEIQDKPIFPPKSLLTMQLLFGSSVDPYCQYLDSLFYLGLPDEFCSFEARNIRPGYIVIDIKNKREEEVPMVIISCQDESGLIKYAYKIIYTIEFKSHEVAKIWANNIENVLIPGENRITFNDIEFFNKMLEQLLGNKAISETFKNKVSALADSTNNKLKYLQEKPVVTLSKEPMYSEHLPSSSILKFSNALEFSKRDSWTSVRSSVNPGSHASGDKQSNYVFYQKLP